MLRISEIQNKLLHLIGWQQSYEAGIRIAPELTESESGLYFQQVHPLITLQNLSSIAPNFDNLYPLYDPSAEYLEGAIVRYNGKIYIALSDVMSEEPDSSEYWKAIDPFSDWIESKTKAGIQKAITRICNDKLQQGTYKTLCENRTLFDGTGRIVDTVANKNNLVGFEIIPVRSKGVTTKINKIGLQFTKAGIYRLYIMHSSSYEPIRVIELKKEKDNSMEWFSIDNLYLPYQGPNNDAGGSWYICYFQDELPEGSQAIYKAKDWSQAPCASCSRSELLAWQAWSKYIEVHPFYVNAEFVDRPTSIGVFNSSFSGDYEKQGLYLWDIENNQYTYNTNYGLNLDITVGCDITDFIIEQRMLFQDVIAKQVGVDLLREFAFNANVRTNRHSINAARADILYELDGDSGSMKKSGLSYQLDLAYEAVELSIQGMDRICLPCKNNGIKYRTV